MHRYSLLLEGVNDLVKDTSRLAEIYERTNTDFAHLIYENGLNEIMEKAGQLKDYERGFELMYYTLKGQVEHLKTLRKVLNLIVIKDPVNYPIN